MDTPSVEALPAELADAIAGAELRPVTVGRSGSLVARAVGDGRPDRFVKLVRRGSAAPSLAAEAERLRWLAGRLAVPEVVLHGGDDEAEWLVTTALDGVDATAPELAVDVERLARLLGHALRHLHDALDPADCPFDGSTPVLVDHARGRVAHGLVDAGDFEPIHHGISPEELLCHVIDRQPDPPGDPVVTHGDFCLPNVLFDGGRLSGFVDVGLVGVGDRYRDLGIGARSVARNLGGGAIGPFFDAYGIEWPDLARVDFFVMLDELF